MALMTGPVSPYVTPDLLTQYPLGISWSTIPDPRASPAEKYAAQVLICQTATGMADARCGQVLRSTQQPETLRGPGFRLNALKDGTARLMLSQWPITDISAIRCAPSTPIPYQWTQVTTGQWAVSAPPLLITGSSAAVDSGTGGQSVILGPGYVHGGGRYVVETTYTAGWPHCGLAANASAGDQVLTVDDCTGWAPVAAGEPGALGVIQDTATGQQEAVACLAASAAVGPGVLTLTAPLRYAHNAGLLLSALPNQIQWAAALYAASQALARGSTSTSIQAVRGGRQAAGGSEALRAQADTLLGPFRRVE